MSSLRYLKVVIYFLILTELMGFSVEFCVVKFSYTEYKPIFMEKKVVRSTIYNGACLPGFVSLQSISHKVAVASLSLTVGH